MSATMASRVFVRTLNRVDLPTLGRPTRAMTGSTTLAARRLNAHRHKGAVDAHSLQQAPDYFCSWGVVGGGTGGSGAAAAGASEAAGAAVSGAAPVVAGLSSAGTFRAPDMLAPIGVVRNAL